MCVVGRGYTENRNRESVQEKGEGAVSEDRAKRTDLNCSDLGS